LENSENSGNSKNSGNFRFICLIENSINNEVVPTTKKKKQSK
jgi:hypothetical protein